MFTLPSVAEPLAAISRAPQPLASETRSPAVLYDLAWGKSWPRHGGIVHKTEIGQVNTEDELYFDGGVDAIPNALTYDCLEDIGKVTAALWMTPGFLDVLVVREEYDRVRKILESIEHKAFVVTGHPGIGTTTFLFYLLLYRLERKLPTAVQFSNHHYFVFDEHGARARQLCHNDPGLQNCWALSDSNSFVVAPYHSFQCRAQRVIHITPPEPSRWKQWAKHCAAAILYMDLPKVMEIGAVLKELRLDAAVTLGLVGRWGPSMRTIITLVKYPALTPQYHHAAEGAGRDLAMMTFSALVASGVGRIPTSQSSEILFIRPEGGTDRFIANLTIPTKFLSEILHCHTSLLPSDKLFDLFGKLSSYHLTRTSAGSFHEMDMHHHMCIGGNALHLYRVDTQGQMELMPPSRVLPGTKFSLQRASAAQSFYWMSAVVDLPGIDGIYGDINGDVFALQATTAVDHVDPHEGLKQAWMAMPTRQHCQWNYVLVCRSQDEVEPVLDVFMPHLKDLKVGATTQNVTVWISVVTFMP
ncbi:hypothetical protein CPB85DRAFT_1214792 [Mucidula mucida]|nr:hypothetical protein CPB85DRAFT_1214792 [Mucidula mucida]